MRKNPFKEIYKSSEYILNKDNKMPLIVDVELTNNCNLSCKMCSRANMCRKKGFMDRDTFEKLVDECKKYGIPMRFIGWGEPFLHPEIISYLKYAKPLLLHITNNGQIIREDQMEELVDMRLDSIIFSFQGATKEGYESMRVGASYDKTVENINKLIDIRGNKDKPFIHISSTMTDETEAEKKAFISKWKKIVDSVDIGITNLHNENRIPQYKPCSEVWHKLTVKWDGSVSACCGDYDDTLLVGDLTTSTLKEIWKGEELKAVRTLLTSGRFRNLTLCKNCFYAYNFS